MEAQRLINDRNIKYTATKLYHEMLELIGTQDVSCSMHESEVTTSIILKSNAIESSVFTIIKSKQAITKKILRNKVSTNRVREATEQEEQVKICDENKLCEPISNELNQALNLTLESATNPNDITSNLEFNQVSSCNKECNVNIGQTDQNWKSIGDVKKF